VGTLIVCAVLVHKYASCVVFVHTMLGTNKITMDWLNNASRTEGSHSYTKVIIINTCRQSIN